MARTTYGRSMAEWERRQDEANWRRSINLSIEEQNYKLFAELAKEGISEEYDFPQITDPVAKRILENLYA